MIIGLNKGMKAYNILLNEGLIEKDKQENTTTTKYTIGILNLMPTKETTETQLLRLLAKTSFNIEVIFIKLNSHISKNTSQDHLDSYYNYFDEVKTKKIDGLIITGAPVEKLEFTEVDYWKELCDIMDYAKENSKSTLFICWAAQAALFYYYGIQKHFLPKKLSGIYEHIIKKTKSKIIGNIPLTFFAPHSRYTEVYSTDIENNSSLNLVSTSEEAGMFIAESSQNKMIFISGHPEYDAETLQLEYERDLKKFLDSDLQSCTTPNPEIPKNYFPNNNPALKPTCTWKTVAEQLYKNWLEYYVVPMEKEV